MQRCKQAIAEKNESMTKVSTNRLVKLLEDMSNCEALGSDLKAQSQQLVEIVCSQEYDVTVTRASLDAVENKKAKGLLYTFQALGKHFIMLARQNLSETSTDESLVPIVAHLKDLTVALNATTPSDGWLATAKSMVENLGQIASAGSRSFKHRVIADVQAACLALQKGVSKLNSDCLAYLDTDISERICPIAVAEKDYDGLMAVMVKAQGRELTKDLHNLASRIGQDIVEPLREALAVPGMSDDGDAACWKVLADATFANDEKYDAWSVLVEAVGKGGVAHSDVKTVACAFNTHGCDGSHIKALYLLFRF